MKNLFKTISWLLTSVITLTIAIAYICPMTMDRTTATDTAHSLCNSDTVVLSMTSMPGCLGIHGGIVAELTNAIPQITNLLLAFILLVIVHNFFSRNFLTTFLQSKLCHWRRLYIDYKTNIKMFVEERMLSYLNFLGNYTVASLA